MVMQIVAQKTRESKAKMKKGRTSIKMRTKGIEDFKKIKKEVRTGIATVRIAMRGRRGKRSHF